MKIITIANQKGGCGKTTTAMNLAVGLVDAGKKVLGIDLDIQGHFCKWLGYTFDNQPTIYEALNQEVAGVNMFDVCNCIRHSEEFDMDYIPSSAMMGTIISVLGADKESDNVLSRFLHREEFASYDFIVIDCPNGFNLLITNALNCCDKLLIPVQAEFLSYDGVDIMLNALIKIKQTEQIEQYLLGLLITMYDKRRVMSREVIESAKESYGDLVLDIYIPLRSQISDSTVTNKITVTLNRGARSSDAAEAYKKIVQFVLERV